MSRSSPGLPTCCAAFPTRSALPVPGGAGMLRIAERVLSPAQPSMIAAAANTGTSPRISPPVRGDVRNESVVAGDLDQVLLGCAVQHRLGFGRREVLHLRRNVHRAELR